MAYTITDGSERGEQLLHHAILRPPKGHVVVHRNGNGLDNRRANLLLVSKAALHEHVPRRSGQEGVWWGAEGEGWLDLLVQSEVVTIGPYASLEAAMDARARLHVGVSRPTPQSKLEPDDEDDAMPPPEPRRDEPAGSVRGVRAPRGVTGYAGVAFDTRNRSYVVSTSEGKRRFQDLALAVTAASIEITRARRREACLGERIIRFGGYEVLLDAKVADWLPALGPWYARRRRSGLLDVRRARPDAGDPNVAYTTAADLVACPGPEERVEFVNGDRLDLRTTNLRVVSRREDEDGPDEEAHRDAGDEELNALAEKVAAELTQAARDRERGKAKQAGLPRHNQSSMRRKVAPRY